VNSRGRAAAGVNLRWAATAVALAALVTAVAGGCSGGADDRERPPGALAAALSHVPVRSGAAIAVATDPAGGPRARLHRLARRSHDWARLERGFEASFSRAGLDARLLPNAQLGNPFVLGVGGTEQPVGAMRLRDPARFRGTVAARIASGRATRLPEIGKAFAWREGGALAAIDRSEVVVARSRADLQRAVDAGTGDSLAYDPRFLRGLELDRRTLLRAFGDARRLLGDNKEGPSAQLLRIPWVSSLGDFGATARLAARSVRLELRLGTDRTPLSASELPLKTGSATPRLHDLAAPATLALLEPDRLARFAERSLAVTDPDAYSSYSTGLSQLRSLFAVDLHRDLLEKIANLSIAISSATSLNFVARLEHGTRDDVVAALRRAEPGLALGIGDVLPGTSLAGRGSGSARVWTIRRGRLTVARYAVRSGSLVAAIGSARLPRPVLGAKLAGTRGSLAIEGDIGRVGRLLGTLLAFPADTIDLFSGLGDIELGIRTEVGGLVGRGKVEVGGTR
jgi:hypothetical protein